MDAKATGGIGLSGQEVDCEDVDDRSVLFRYGSEERLEEMKRSEATSPSSPLVKGTHTFVWPS